MVDIVTILLWRSLVLQNKEAMKYLQACEDRKATPLSMSVEGIIGFKMGKGLWFSDGMDLYQIIITLHLTTLLCSWDHCLLLFSGFLTCLFFPLVWSL